MYDIEEEIIEKLEEIDTTFSKINKVLESIKNKSNNFSIKNKKIIEDLHKYFNLFDIKQRKNKNSFNLEISFDDKLSLNEKSEVSKNSYKHMHEEMGESNPFDSSLVKEVYVEEEDNLNGNEESSIEIPESIHAETFSVIKENKKIKHNESRFFSDLSSSLVKIEEISLPNIFKTDENLFKVYEFIKEKKNVKYEEILNKFKFLDGDTLEIYVQLFISKHLVRCKNGVLYA